MFSTKRTLYISADPFSRDDFFASKLGVKIGITDDFKNLILPLLPETIPAFKQNVTIGELRHLTPYLQAGIEGDRLFEPWEAIAVFAHFAMRQSEGEDSNLTSARSQFNIAYTKFGEVRPAAIFVWARFEEKEFVNWEFVMQEIISKVTGHGSSGDHLLIKGIF